MDEDRTVPTSLRATAHLPAAGADPCLIALTGPTAGTVYRLDQERIILGRGEDADISVNIDGVSRHHAEALRDVHDIVTIRDLGSTNGLWVGGQRVESHTLRDGEHVQLGARVILQFCLHAEEQEKIQQRLYESATRDPLTHALNRRVFDEQLARELSHARRHTRYVGLLVLDIDAFTALNDAHGRAAGDHVLRELAALVHDSVRAEDIFCRLDGQRFAVLNRDPGPEGPAQFAERLRKLVENHYFAFEGERLPVTISVGAASFAPEYPTPEALLGAAVDALMQAKSGGRNRVSVAD